MTQQPENERNFRPRRVSGLPAALLAAFLAPALALVASPCAADQEAAADPAEATRALTLDELRTFTDVFNIVRRNYVDEIPGPELLDSALRGMVGALDRHSAFLGLEAFQRQDDNSKGRYGGIGVSLDVRRQRLVVDRVFRDGPAWRAGVKAGDKILAVNGDPVRGRPLPESLEALKGAPGSLVTVRFRTRQLPPRDVELERAYVPVPSVESELLDDDVALLTLSHFHLESAAEFERRLLALAGETRNGLSGIVLDLRDNPGGVIKAAAEIADGFLDEGLVVYTRGRYPASHLEYHAEPGQWAPGVPLVVLVNGASASAAEILAGALQDHGRATLVGAETYGKGTVQSILELRNGSALKLTTARYFTPAGRSFDRTGIAPDVRLDESPAGEGLGDDAEGDRGLERALELVRERIRDAG